MNPKRSSVARFFLVAALVLGWGMTGNAQVTNQITGVKFGEKLSRSVKFQHLGPILGHHVEFADKGSLNLQFAVSFAGVNPLLIGPTSQYRITILNQAVTELDGGGYLFDDPKYQPGSTKAKMMYTDTFAGKSSVMVTVQMKADPIFSLLTVKVKGVYLSRSVDEVQQEEAGECVLADNNLGDPTSLFQGDALVVFELTDGYGNPLVMGAGTMTFVGGVKSSDVSDPEIGTYRKSSVAVIGTTPP